MEQDDKLREIFADYKPDLGDSAAFMDSLQRQLEAVEYLRQMQKAEARHCRRVTLAALLAGIVAGAAMMAGLLLWPGTAPMFTLGLPGVAQVITPEVARLAGTLVTSLLLGILTMVATCMLLPAPRPTMPDAAPTEAQW